MAKASAIAVKTANLLEGHATQLDRIEAMLTELLAAKKKAPKTPEAPETEKPQE